MAELNEKELEEVAGGKVISQRRPAMLTGVYWGTSYKENGPYNAAIGWTNLFIEQLDRGTAPFRIYHGAVPIGFTVAGNFYYTA